MFTTLKKTHRDFHSYLMGTLPKGYRAIPVQTLNLGTQDEEVTFDCRPINEIKKPSGFKFLATFIKLRSYLLILLPLLFVVVKNFVDDRFRDPFSLGFSIVAMQLLYAGINIRNDVVDHVSGFDRVNIPFTEKPILQGWISARKSNLYAWCLILLAALIAVPTLILQAEEIKVLAVVLILVFLGQIFRGSFYKEKHFGEFILFILIGPGVVSGYQVALGAGIDTEGLSFGVLWGFAALFLVHINNFCHLLTSSQAIVRNTMTNLGFDRAKKFLLIWWLIFIFLFFLFHWFYASTFWAWFGTGLLIFWSFPLLIEISGIRSPLGSDLINLRKKAHDTFTLMTMILMIEYIWYAGVKINWMI